MFSEITKPQDTSIAIYQEKVRGHVALRIATLKKEMEVSAEVIGGGGVEATLHLYWLLGDSSELFK